LTEAKKFAVEQGTTLTALIEGALREVLARRGETQPNEPVRLTTFGGKGVRPGVDLDDSAGLLDWMEERNDSR
jgi:hypothetical protein